jgi:hypothetical protein
LEGFSLGTSNYFVVYRENRWWIIYDGHREGPFSSEGDAQREAIRRETKAQEAGAEGQVWEDVPGDGMPQLYPNERN